MDMSDGPDADLVAVRGRNPPRNLSTKPGLAGSTNELPDGQKIALVVILNLGNEAAELPGSASGHAGPKGVKWCKAVHFPA